MLDFGKIEVQAKKIKLPPLSESERFFNGNLNKRQRRKFDL